jgi:hypothetical protein
MNRIVFVLTVAAVGINASWVRAENQQKTTPATATPQASMKTDLAPPPAPRQSTVNLSLVFVPWGMHYTRSAWGATIAYQVPLVKKNGVLWDSTNITVGVRDLYGYVNNTFGPFIEITPLLFSSFVWRRRTIISSTARLMADCAR